MSDVEKIIETAKAEIGVKENPSGSNNVKYNTDYYGRAVSGSAYPWCAAFCYWVFKKAGLSHLFYGGNKTAYCPSIESYYKSIGRWYTSNPKKGDLVLFDFGGNGVSEHIGILEKVNSDGTYSVIEGNTSVTSNDNGGNVMRRTRYKSQIKGFARPKYDGSTETTQKGENTVNVTLTVLEKGSKGAEVKTLQRLLNALGYSCGEVDGDFGTATEKATKNFQKAKGLTVDGIVGKASWTAILK